LKTRTTSPSAIPRAVASNGFDATFQRDYNLLLGILLFSSVLVVATNFVIDLIYGWLDPRIEAY
jgi:ABC-type dipeptide/oligopeptide/nickel transport system permease component